MDIQINNNDKGLSYAIKRQLQVENVDVSKINSCWTQIMNAFKGDSESKVNGKTIAEQWNTLNAKVKITVNNYGMMTGEYNRETAEGEEKDAETSGIEGARKLFQKGVIEDFEVWGAKNEHKMISEFNSDIVTQNFVNKWFDEQYQHIRKS